jgi:hypothetical protein
MAQIARSALLFCKDSGRPLWPHTRCIMTPSLGNRRRGRLDMDYGGWTYRCDHLKGDIDDLGVSVDEQMAIEYDKPGMGCGDGPSEHVDQDPLVRQHPVPRTLPQSLRGYRGI